MATAQGHQTVSDFLSFGLHEGDAVLLGDRRTDGATANRDAAGEKATALDVKQIAGLRADVDQQDRLLGIAVSGPESVVDRHRRDIDLRGAETAVIDRRV